jgi:predicted aspartyl protease
MSSQGEHGMGRVTVEAEIANYDDMKRAESGLLTPDKVRRARIKGVADSGETRLVLPSSVVAQLGLPATGKAKVRYADERNATRTTVKDVWLKLEGRESTFNAIVEPNRTEALIGAIVLEDLDLLVDCAGQTLRPRDPKWIISEIE